VPDLRAVQQAEEGQVKTRIRCEKHKRWHSKHAAYHCKTGHCTPIPDALRHRTSCPVRGVTADLPDKPVEPVPRLDLDPSADNVAFRVYKEKVHGQA
jgi:hypothetical protein